MLDLGSLIVADGIIPPRPDTLKPFEEITASTTDDMIFKLIASGKYIAIGGLSLVGSAAHEVRIVMFFQINDGDVQGWKLSIGHPDDPEPDFRYIETREVELAKWPFPNAAVYFVGEVDPRLVSETAPPVLLSEAARFIIPFINEDGPPEGIDW